jgi:hypothetical protein
LAKATFGKLKEKAEKMKKMVTIREPLFEEKKVEKPPTNKLVEALMRMNAKKNA